MLSELPLVRVATAFLAIQVLSVAFYSDFGFGTAWQRMALNPKPKYTHNPFVLAAGAHLALVVILQMLMCTFSITTVPTAIQFAFWMATFVAAVDLPHYAFGGKALLLYAIEMVHNYAVLMLCGVLLIVVE